MTVGVNWDKARGQWIARVGFEHKVYNLGRFDTEEEAAEVVSQFRAELPVRYGPNGLGKLSPEQVAYVLVSPKDQTDLAAELGVP